MICEVSMVKKKPKYIKPSSAKAGRTQKSYKNSSVKLSWKQRIILVFKKVFLPIVVPIITTIIGQRILVRLENKKLSELDQVKLRIEEVIPKLRFDFNVADTLLVRNHPDLIIMYELKHNVGKLLLYKEAHEIKDFRGTSIDERLILAKENLSKRNLYDAFALDVISEINNLYQYNQNIDVGFMPILEFKIMMIENMMCTWVNKDTIRNNELIRQIDSNLYLSENEKKLVMKEVSNVLSSFNEDINHYIDKCNFYDFLLDVENFCCLRYNDYCDEKK